MNEIHPEAVTLAVELKATMEAFWKAFNYTVDLLRIFRSEMLREEAVALQQRAQELDRNIDFTVKYQRDAELQKAREEKKRLAEALRAGAPTKPKELS